jgi:hypothetical protein
MLMAMPDGRRALWRPRHRWEDEIKMYLGNMVWGVMDWIDLGQDGDQWRPLVNKAVNLQVP